MKRSKYTLIIAAGLIASAANVVVAQNTGQDKPYQEWTKAEVEKLLSDSPWAITQDKGVAIGYDNPAASGLNTVPPPEAVTLRLRSALHVRQALLRLRQIRAKYEKMSDGDKASFDNKNKPLIDCPACADNYVVALGPGTGGRRGVPSILELMTLAEAKLNVQIGNERGERRELVHFIPPKVQGDEAVFFFARTDEKGQPLLDQNTRRVIVTFAPKIFNSPVTITKFDFDVSKMMVNGVIDF